MPAAKSEQPVVEVAWKRPTSLPPKRAALLRLLFADTEDDTTEQATS